MREKKPVSRAGNSWFARVYRAKWIGPRSFADRNYGSTEAAEAAAWKWVKRVDQRLPLMPSKPVLKKASFRMRNNRHGRYYDVYLPRPGKGKPQFRRLYFNLLDAMPKQGEKAHQLVEERNAQLLEAYQLSYAAWTRQCERIMQEVLKIWKELK